MTEANKLNLCSFLDNARQMALLADLYVDWLSYPIFPVSPKAGNKKPLIEGGFKAASKDPEVVRNWWQHYRGALIGLPTGSVSGIYCLDIDVKNNIDGVAQLRALEDQNEILPPTFTVMTPSGGYHLYFKMPPDIHIPCSASQISPNLDVRANGGYVVAAGSINEEHQEYMIIDDHEVAVLPGWLQNLSQHSSKKLKQNLLNGSISEGGRNNNLTRILGSLRAHGMESDELFLIAVEINKKFCNPPLSEKEVCTIAQSVGKMARAYSFNNMGNSERFIDRYAHQFKCLNKKDWYHWEDGVWKQDTRCRANEMAKQIAIDLKSEADALARGENSNG